MGDGQELSGRRVWGTASPRNSLGVATQDGSTDLPRTICHHPARPAYQSCPQHARAVNCCDQDLLPPQLIDCVTQTEETPASFCLCKGHSHGLLGLRKSWFKVSPGITHYAGGVARQLPALIMRTPGLRGRSLTQAVSLPHIHACLAPKCSHLRAEHKASGPLKYWGPSNLCPVHTSTPLPAPPSFPLAKGSHTHSIFPPKLSLCCESEGRRQIWQIRPLEPH